ncbi:DUF4189 domain-containing protein [Lysobacter sp. K5869]|uniref:DUF4189 domain-containing protein n=1 Tax=Lysobacter sp. K5869 TaxID=2820808 RepID=UPI001C061ECA|nr:DUF4189 domain-containing protein [Lysobacter sp. K5869]QWP78726.1 DUF4189 domain-containing protein [Lysobacter sp. K5869]
MNKLLLAALLLGLPFAALAQPTNQSGVLQFPGCAAGVAPGQPGCGGVEDEDPAPATRKGAANAQRNTTGAGDGWLPYETGEWTESYGAYADDGKGEKGTGGRSEDSRSAAAARNEALRDCGRDDCEIRIEVRNGCWGVAYGRKGVYYYRTGVDMKAADPKTLGLKTVEREALSVCKKAGDLDCSVKNTSCSLPSR